MMMSLKKEMVGLVQQQNNYVYIVRCSDQTLYTGWTNHLEKRIEAHNAGKGAKYTKARRPVELVYFETFEHKSEALKREYQIKQLKRFEKEKLIDQAEKEKEPEDLFGINIACAIAYVEDHIKQKKGEISVHNKALNP